MNIFDIKTFLKKYPNGISAQERDAIHKSFFTTYGNPYLSSAKWPTSVVVLDTLFDAYSMLESCFAYDGIQQFYKEQPYWRNDTRSYYEQYKDRFMKKGGNQTDFDNAIENQKNFLSTHCSVVYGVGIDGEGNSYNAIVPNN